MRMLCDVRDITLLDMVEYDIENYQGRGLCYWIAQTEAFENNSRYHSKPESTNCFITYLLGCS